MNSEMAELWANESDHEIQKALGQLDGYKSEAVDIIRMEAEKRGINIPDSLVAQSHHKQDERDLLHRLFAKQNLSVGWSSFWFGLVTGIPWTLIIYSFLIIPPIAAESGFNLGPTSSPGGIIVVGTLFAVVVNLVVVVWLWRHFRSHGWVIRSFMTRLCFYWIILCPLNLTFSLSCRRAVYRHRGIEVGPFAYGAYFFLFAVLIAVTWLVTGLPLGLLLDRLGEPGVIQFSIFGLWLLAIPVITLYVFGYCINTLANDIGRVRDQDINTAE